MLVIKQFFIILIRAYQYCISPFFPPTCRYTPTCSTYSKQCFEKFPIHLALWYSTKRILSCHPFHAGGSDPVPTKKCL